MNCSIVKGISDNTGRNIKSLSSSRKIFVVVCWIGNVDHNNGKYVMCFLISVSCFQTFVLLKFISFCTSDSSFGNNQSGFLLWDFSLVRISPDIVTSLQQGKSCGRISTLSLWKGMFSNGISSIKDTSRCLRPEQVYEWPDSILARWWWWNWVSVVWRTSNSFINTGLGWDLGCWRTA